MPVRPARTLAHPLAFYRTAPPDLLPTGPAASAPGPERIDRSRPARPKPSRRPPDRTQLIRRSLQAAFLLLNVWIGVQFYLFVRYFETAGQSVYVPRPPGVEGWLPIAALMNLRYFLLTGTIATVHPAAMFLLVAFGAISLLFRKAFCSWLCPVGTISEWLWQGGHELLGRNFALPRWLDIPLRGLKYLLLGLFLYAVGRMTAGDIQAFLEAPYGLIADVKMLNFFRALGSTAAIVIGVLVVLSVFVKNAWCRYLCPYGALMGLVALFSPVTIRRDADACIDCGKCAKACPSVLPVDVLRVVRSAECSNCLECVSACPVAGALDLAARRRVVPGWAVAVGIAAIFFGLVGYARFSGHWQTPLPTHTYFDLIPKANGFGHPGY